MIVLEAFVHGYGLTEHNPTRADAPPFNLYATKHNCLSSEVPI